MRKMYLAILVLLNAGLLAAQQNNRVLIDLYRSELTERGDLKQPKIDELVAAYEKILTQRKAEFKPPVTALLLNSPVDCRNGGFEDTQNAFAGWTFFTGCNQGGIPIGSGIQTSGSYMCCTALAPNVQGTSTVACGQLHAIRNAGPYDPVLNGVNMVPKYMMPVVPLGGGGKSAVLGNAAEKYGVEGLFRVVTLPAVNPVISFKYASVMQKSHSNGDGSMNGSEVFFLVRVRLASNNSEIKRYEEVGNPNNPFVQASMDTLNKQIYYFRDWECVSLDLKGYEGKKVIVEFINSDCSGGGHWGYTYLDDFCVECQGRPAGGGTVVITRADSCILGNSTVAGNFVLPTLGGNTGTLTSLQLLIYQNGVVVATLNNASISGTNYSFPVTPADFPPNASITCYDVIVKATFSLMNPYSGQTSTITGYSAPTALGEGIKKGKNNDMCLCPEYGCCPGRTQINNGFFNAGNSGFTSDYSFESTYSANSVMPGEYGIVTGSAAAAVSSQWNVKDPNTCDNSGKFMVVNGRTGQSGKKKIWEQTVSGLTPNSEYRFCAKMKNLPQCAFDVKPAVELQFSSGAAPLNQVINTTSGACDWVEVSVVVKPTASTLTIKILLDETPAGDGNDLAIDAIGLYAMPPLTQAYRDFTVQSLNMNASTQTYNLLATPVVALPAGCGYFWDICEINCPGACKDCNSGDCKPGTQVANPSQWWTGGTTNFPGYNGTSTLSGSAPGVFQYGKRYLIKRGVFCDCNAWSESKWCIEYDPGARKVVTRVIN